MRISAIERREVAARLRENAGLPSRLPNEYSIEAKSALVLSKLLDCIECSDDVFLRLADLIDRPTCKNAAEPYDGSFFECLKCGERWELTCGSPADNNLCFCPRCGAEVVPDGC